MLRGSIPPTGLLLPFISAGSTSLLVFMGAIGILCNVGKSKENGGEFKKSGFNINWFKGKKKKENNT